VHFCCLGCLYVFQVLYNSPEGIPDDYRNTELYRACVSAGLIPSGEAEDNSLASPRPETLFVPPAQLHAGMPAGGAAVPEMAQMEAALSQELSIHIEGMWCVACSWLIEQLVRKMDGVLSAGVFFFSDIARIRYMPHLISPEAIVQSISRLGYRASLDAEEAAGAYPGLGQSRDLSVRLGVSAILSMNIMMISFALWAGFFEEIGRQGAALFSYTLWVIASPVVFYGGWPILRKAFQGIRHWSPTMDTLIGIGVLSAYFYSVISMLRGSIHVYFDTASMLVTLVLLGRFIESRAKEKISGTINALFHAASGKVRILRGGRQVWTAPDTVCQGEMFLVFPGERVPVDGRIVSGQAVLDESIITGESRPLKLEAGAEAPAGSLLLDGEAEFEADRPGDQSSLSQTISLIQEALSTKNRFELFADRAIKGLVPAVLVIAASTAVFLCCGR
jgi:cation transport ATPase